MKFKAIRYIYDPYDLFISQRKKLQFFKIFYFILEIEIHNELMN